MKLLFVDQEEARLHLLPLTYTRPIADLRVGILTLSEKWAKHLVVEQIGYSTANFLQDKYPPIEADSDTYRIFDGLLPTSELLAHAAALSPQSALVRGGRILVARGAGSPESFRQIPYEGLISSINYCWDIFRLNGQEIRADYELLTRDKTSAPLNDPHTITYGSAIFLEEGAQVKAATLNAENGPIYLGKHSEIQEGALIRGPFGLGEHSIVSMGAKVRGDSSTGPFCNRGGEISNSVLWGYSSKAHDGFLGNSVLGQWCNIGADTNTSNLKNSYDNVRVWSYATSKFEDTGLQFCGLIMGDHSKAAINTMFNTGTVVGVAANVFGEGFPRTIIPSFAWGGASGFVTHQLRKALHTASLVMARRNLTLSDQDKAILTHIFEESAQYRVWEKQ